MSEPEDLCKCGRADKYDWSHDCPYVDCDDPTCFAPADPRTPDEFEYAYEHWRFHGYLSGCSHAN